MVNKIIQTRNPRVSLDNNEIEYLLNIVDNEIIKSQKFDYEEMLFKLKLYKKLREAK